MGDYGRGQQTGWAEICSAIIKRAVHQGLECIIESASKRAEKNILARYSEGNYCLFLRALCGGSVFSVMGNPITLGNFADSGSLAICGS